MLSIEVDCHEAKRNSNTIEIFITIFDVIYPTVRVSIVPTLKSDVIRL